MNVKKLRDVPEQMDRAASWFSKTWKIPLAAYQASMQQCIAQKEGVPQWYIVLDDGQNIIAGAGVIDNDFHARKDLTPNLCALFVEEAYRNQGIARHILNFVKEDMGGMGIKTLYLVTDHTEFYEKCGWSFFTMVNDDEGVPERMYRTDC